MAKQPETRLTKNQLVVTTTPGLLDTVDELIHEYLEERRRTYMPLSDVLRKLYQEQVPYEEALAAITFLDQEKRISVHEEDDDLYVDVEK